MESINWDELYIANASKLKGVCRRYVGDASIAEDLVQETFITAMDKIHTFKSMGAVEGWIRKIAVNKALLFLRERRSDIPFDDWDKVLSKKDEETVMGQRRSKIRAVIERASFSSTKLLSILDRLPEHHKTVFNLYVLDGYSHKQIAGMLNISTGTSKSHLSRARKKARNLLYEEAQSSETSLKKRDSLSGILFWVHPVDLIFKDGLQNYKLDVQPVPEIIKRKYVTKKTSLMKNILVKIIVFGAIVSGAIVFCFRDANRQSERDDVANDNVHVLNADSVEINEGFTLIDSQEIKQPTSSVNLDTLVKTASDTPVVIKKTIVVHDTVRLRR